MVCNLSTTATSLQKSVLSLTLNGCCMSKKVALYSQILTLVLLNLDIPAFANSVDPDQLASEEANLSESALFVVKYEFVSTTQIK